MCLYCEQISVKNNQILDKWYTYYTIKRALLWKDVTILVESAENNLNEKLRFETGVTKRYSKRNYR
jgi:hypothetical protein